VFQKTGLRRILAPLTIHNYRWYFIVGLCISSSFGMQMLAFSWVMYDLTGKPAMVGLNMVATAIPQLLLGFPGGVVADRISKRTIMMATFSLSGLIFATVGLAHQMGVLNWWYLVGASIGMGAVTSFQMPSRQGIVAQLVGREQLTAAIALNQANMNVTQLAAPAVAGLLISEVSIAAAFYAIAALNFLGVLGLLPMRLASVPPKAQWTVKMMFGNVIEGFRYVRKNGRVRTILVFSLITASFAMPYMALLPVLAKDVLHVDARGLGLLMTCSGVGALIGSLAITTVGKARRGLLFLHTAMVTGISLLLLSVSPWYAATMGVMAVLGLAGSARMAFPNILLQTYTEDGYLGRVLSLMLLQFAITSFGAFFISLAAQFIGVQLALAACAVCLIATTVLYYRFSTSMKSLA
jgi:MFS family permease